MFTGRINFRGTVPDMINIVCGEINSGKTAKIESIYAKEKNGDGFITRKIFRDSLFIGYEIVRLSSGESKIQSLKNELFPPGELPACARGPYTFFKEGFSFADAIVDDIIRKGISPVFIDEIGPIELQGKGHCSCFKKVLQTDCVIYFAVRDWCLEQAVRSFSIKEYNLIRT